MLGFHPIAGAPLSSLGAGELTLSGLQVVATGGALTPHIEVALTGHSMTASYGTMGAEVPLLTPQVATASSGTLIPHILIVPTGQSVTATGGTITPHITVALTGQSCTASAGQLQPPLVGALMTAAAGTITPEVSVQLTGYTMTVQSTSPGFIVSDSAHVVVGLLGYTPAIQSGTITPNVLVGTATMTWAYTPSVVEHVAANAGFSRVLDRRKNQFVYYRGKYVGFSENHDGAADDHATVLSNPSGGAEADPETRLEDFSSTFDYTYSTADLNPAFSGAAFQTFAGSGKTYSAAPRKWALGPMWTVSEEGELAALRTRTEDRFLSYPNRTRHIAYQPFKSWNPSQYHGVELTHDIDNSLYESAGAAEDGPVNDAMGLVVLKPRWSKTPSAGDTPVSTALVFHPSLWNNGADNWVPTYTKVALSYRNDAEGAASATTRFLGNDKQLRSFTGVTNLWAMNHGLVVTYSGYGNVAYLTYLASTSGTPRTPAYVGVITMDLETEEVFAHVVKPLGTVITPYTPADVRDRQFNVPYRPVSEAVRLSTGRSVTQFVLRGYVVNLSWTAGTYRNPMVVAKDAPTAGGSNEFARGVDVLEAKGDSVYHVLYEVVSTTDYSANGAATYGYRTVVNDATGTGASWTTAGSDTWSWFLDWAGVQNHVPAYYVGSKVGKQTWFFQAEYINATGGPNSKLLHGEAWIDFFADQPDFMSVAAEGRLGQLVPVVTPCGISVQLTGHQIAVTASNGLISGENKSVALTGHQINANYTSVGGVSNVVVPLVGHQMECAQGRMSLIGDPVSVALVGHHICMQMNTPSTLPPGTVQLSGFGLTAYYGTMVPHIAVTLTGQSCTASGGTLDASVPLLSGLSVTASSGTLVPAIAVTLPGQQATAVTGSLGVSSGVTLTGQSAPAVVGTLVPHISVALTGHAMTASVGTLVPTCGVTLTGQQATCVQGTPAPTVSIGLQGVAIVSASGAFVPLHTVNLASNVLTASAGSFVVFMARALSGQVMTVQQGAMGLNYDCNITLNGVQVRGQVGSLATNLPTPAAGAFLWANDVRDDELFAVVSQLDS